MKRTLLRALLKFARIAASTTTATAAGLIVAYVLILAGSGESAVSLGFWLTAVLVNALALDATRAWEPA